MRTWIMILFLGITYTVRCQDIKGQNCDILKKVVELDKFKEHFWIKNLRDSNITFIDTVGYFTDCSFLNSDNKLIEISRYWPDHIKSIGKGNSLNSKGLFVLYKLDKKRKNYILYIWEPLNNGSMNVRYKIKIHSIKILNVSWGVF